MDSKRVFFILIAVLLIGGVLLGLDLSQRGLFWQFAWSVTGEEEPIAQLNALPQWLMGYTRPQPETASMVPMQHANVTPYGINTFLHQEVEIPKIEAMMRTIADAGFVWLREEFPWEDIEVDGRGQFTDSRNDLTGDGVADARDAWEKYDHIVELSQQYDLRILARLSNPPAWSRSDPEAGSLGPPDDFQDFVNYAVAVAERYQGAITHYQIWNEPNLYLEWGNQPVDPEAFTDLLCRTYDAVKAVDPEIVILAPALSPTVALDGYNLNDFIYLQRMYDAGAAECFDVMAMQGYGLFSGPTDHRLRPTTVNIMRPLYIRDIMVQNGDAHKSIWISEAAWNSVPSAEEVPNIVGYREQYGQVTQQQAADYMVDYYQRVQEDWPFVGVVNYWFFTRRDASEQDQPMYYFRMVEPDYQPEKPTFTPLPVYDAMREYITTQTPTLYRGIHQVAGHWAITVDENAAPVETPDSRYGEALDVHQADFTAHGTDVVLYWRGADSLTVTVEGETQEYEANAIFDGWTRSTVTSSLMPQTVAITVEAAETVELDAVLVLDRSVQNVLPLAAVALTGVFMLVLSITVGWMERRRAS